MRKKTNFVDRNGNDIFVDDRVRITEVSFLGKPAVSEGKVYYDKSDDSYGIRFFPKGDDCGFDDLLEDYLDLCEVIKDKKMRQLPSLPLELLQSQTILNLTNSAKREEFRQSLMQTIDLDDLSSVREEIPELGHWSDEEVIVFGNLWAENIYEVSGFQAPSRDGWLNMLALSDTLSYPIEKCLESFYGYGIFKIDEIDGIYNAWLVDNEEAKKKISWNLESNDPKGYLDGLVRRAGQL